MSLILKIFLFIFLLLPSIIFAQQVYVESSSWEAEDIVPIYSNFDETQNYIISPAKIILSKLIKFYQEKISTQSISRCPFKISCSNYAYISVQKYGIILGTCFFIDRYFYRENSLAYLHYNLSENESGILKLDDSFYLLGDNKN